MARWGRFPRLPMLSSLLSPNPSFANSLANVALCRTVRQYPVSNSCAPMSFCLRQVESRAADYDLLVAGSASAAFSRLEQPFAIRHDDIDTAQTFAASVGCLDEADARVIERHLDTPARIVAQRKLRDTAPSFGQTARIRRLQFHRPKARDHVGAPRRIPIAAARGLPMSFGLALLVAVQLEECAACIGGMKLHTVKALGIVLPCDTDVEFRGAGLARRLRRLAVALAYHHVAAVAVAPLQIAAGGSVLLDRRHHLDKVATDRKERILQAEHFHSFVLEADLEPQYRLEIINHRRELC